jgi:UDP:flavonoid glycosyltransferase YjiC (YdhE family)
VVAPIRSHLRPDTVIPDNVLVTDWLPALEVNRLVDCAVIHGGSGTVQTAIHAGIPFVGIGMQPEQSINIESVVRWGAAIRLPRKRLTPVKVESAVMELLSNDSFAKRAKGLASEGAEGVGAHQVAHVVREALS